MNTTFNQNTINANQTNVNPTFPTVTSGITLGDLIAALHLSEKQHDMPTPKALRETAGDPVAVANGILVYGNGYAVYDNGSGRTVIWLPDCLSFTYYFNPMKDSEIGGEIKQTCDLPEGMLESLPWPIAVTLIGDHRIEGLAMQRKGDRKQNKSLIRGDNEEGDALDGLEEKEDSLRKEYSWREDRFGESPESVYIRKETREEMLASMTDKQREVFVLYYQYGYTQQEIADMVGISKQSVNERLEGALKKAKKRI